MSGINKRKVEHIRIVLEEDVEPAAAPFAKYKLPWKALPEIDLAEIDTSIKFFGKRLTMPFLVSSMTGGPAKAATINENLAKACEEFGVGLALGSMRVILRDPAAVKSFNVRKFCPSIPLFANMGLVQLNYGYGADEINRIIDAIDADGIFLHINHLQEAVQPEGDTNFKDLIPKLAKILPKIKRPVLIKEVGAGIDFATAKSLAEIGIKWIDVAGLGGTSWTWVEAYRRKDQLGHLFKDIGIATDEAIIQCKKVKGLNLIAGGGLRSGLDMAKAIVLGADMTTAAKPLLKPALESPAACIKWFKETHQELKVAMFCAGVKDLSALRKLKLSLV